VREHWLQANGSGVCQAALPSYEGQIRKRPLAIQNEGTAAAFITCSPSSLQYVPMQDFGHGVFLANNSAASVTVNCTAVMGSGGVQRQLPAGARRRAAHGVRQPGARHRRLNGQRRARDVKKPRQWRGFSVASRVCRDQKRYCADTPNRLALPS
jgi:hypothetical protein